MLFELPQWVRLPWFCVSAQCCKCTAESCTGRRPELDFSCSVTWAKASITYCCNDPQWSQITTGVCLWKVESQNLCTKNAGLPRSHSKRQGQNRLRGGVLEMSKGWVLGFTRQSRYYVINTIVTVEITISCQHQWRCKELSWDLLKNLALEVDPFADYEQKSLIWIQLVIWPWIILKVPLLFTTSQGNV